MSEAMRITGGHWLNLGWKDPAWRGRRLKCCLCEEPVLRGSHGIKWTFAEDKEPPPGIVVRFHKIVAHSACAQFAGRGDIVSSSDMEIDYELVRGGDV